MALALALADPLADEEEEVALLPPIPGLSSKETSLARSPHRASRAGRQLLQEYERDTNLRRKVEYRSNRSFYSSAVIDIYRKKGSLVETMPDVGSELLSRAKAFSLVPSLSEPCLEMMNVPSSSTACTSPFFETPLLTFVPFYTVC